MKNYLCLCKIQYIKLFLTFCLIPLISSSYSQEVVIRKLSWGMNLNKAHELEGNKNLLSDGYESFLLYSPRLVFGVNIDFRLNFCEDGSHLWMIEYRYPSGHISKINTNNHPGPDYGSFTDIQTITRSFLEKYGSPSYILTKLYVESDKTEKGTSSSRAPTHELILQDLNVDRFKEETFWNYYLRYDKIDFTIQWQNKPNSESYITMEVEFNRYEDLPIDEDNFYISLIIFYNEKLIDGTSFNCDTYLNKY